MRNFIDTTAGKITVAAVALLVAAVAVFLIIVKPWESDTSEVDAAPEGYTNEVTVPTRNPDEAQPAQPKPSAAPPMIFAEGDCKVALDGIRAVMSENPSGLNLSDEGREELNAALPALSTDCDLELAKKFQDQELGPWLNYAVE